MRSSVDNRWSFLLLCVYQNKLWSKHTMDEELLIDGWECDFEQYDYDDFEHDDIRDYL